MTNVFKGGRHRAPRDAMKMETDQSCAAISQGTLGAPKSWEKPGTEAP